MATSHDAVSVSEAGLRAAAVRDAWACGGSPFAIGSKKLGMWLFIVSDAITFASMLIAYSYVRVASKNWPMPFEFFPSIANATVKTAILLSSSLTMVMGVRASKLGNRSGVVKWLLATMLGGA